MKKLFISLLLMLTLGVTSLLANEKPDVFVKAKAALKREFVGVESVTWTDLGEYQTALFVFENYRIEAFFNAEGELEGYHRYIAFNQLPVEVMRSFIKKYANADIIDVMEITNIEGTSYLLTIEVKNIQYHVKIASGGNLVKALKVVVKPI